MTKQQTPCPVSFCGPEVCDSLVKEAHRQPVEQPERPRQVAYTANSTRTKTHTHAAAATMRTTVEMAPPITAAERSTRRRDASAIAGGPDALRTATDMVPG